MKPMSSEPIVRRKYKIFLESRGMAKEEEGKKAINGGENIVKECHAVLIILDRFNLRRWRREL